MKTVPLLVTFSVLERALRANGVLDGLPSDAKLARVKVDAAGKLVELIFNREPLSSEPEATPTRRYVVRPPWAPPVPSVASGGR